MYRDIERIVSEDIKKGSRKWYVSGRVRLRPDKCDDVFSCLTDKECKLIGMHSVMREIRTKERIYSQGVADNNIYMLNSGVVKLTKITSQGNKLITDILGRRTIFGGMTDTDNRKRNESAIALQDGLVCAVSKADFSRIGETSPKLAIKMKGLMEERRRESEDRLVDLLFRTVEQRFARTLMNLIADFGSFHKSGYLLNISLTHQAYADLVASTRETVTTVLNRLRKKGIIDYVGKKIVVLSVDKLNEIARLREP